MKTSSAFLLATANLVAGHATFQSFVIEGKDQGQHFAVQTPSNSNNPILDVTSPSMICNGGKATSDQVQVAAGSSLTMQWHHNDPASSGDADEPIAASHKGPVMVYIAPAASNGEGAVWTKLYEAGYSNGKWATDDFISAKGQITVKLPDLKAGDYLIRPEIIALHEAETPNKAQLYNGCGQIKVTGSGSVPLPTSGTDMTKAYRSTDPGILVNIYYGLTTYQIPGPAVWDGIATGGSTPSSPSQPATPVKSAQPSSSAKPSGNPSSPPSGSSPTPSKPSQAPAPGYSATPPHDTQPTYSAKPSAPSSSSNSSSTLPKTFTIEQFITWLKTQTGSSTRRTRRHAREFET